MTGADKGFLLLGSRLGNPERRVLTTAQLRLLARRVRAAEKTQEDREIAPEDIGALGYGPEESRRIYALLSEEELLQQYLIMARQYECVPLSWVSPEYPQVLKQRLGEDSPGAIWAIGDLSLLQGEKIALVGSRDILPDNADFAREVGKQAALQGYTLVSGNARGADAIAQRSCLKHGGKVISIVADDLKRQRPRENVLFLSEQDYDAQFTAQRALSRNRIIHALAQKVFVAQATLNRGGTWDGTLRNLLGGWSPVFCFDDGSEASKQLEQLGADLIDKSVLSDLTAIQGKFMKFF